MRPIPLPIPVPRPILVPALLAVAVSMTSCSTTAAAPTMTAPSVVAAPSIVAAPSADRPTVPTATPSGAMPLSSPVASVPATSAAPGSDPTPSRTLPAEVVGGPAPSGTFVLGDSIILGPGVGPRLAEYGYTVVGVVGQSATEAYLRTHLASPAAQSARSWVIELGTNNSGDSGDIARLEGLVDVIDSLRTPSARQRVYWVTPYRPSTYAGSKSAQSLDPFIAELARLAQDRPWLRLIDWAGAARFNEDWFDEDGMHLHPDATGQAVLLAMIAGPDARPVTTPSPLLTPSSAPRPSSPEPEPETFVNRPAPDASSAVAASPTPIPATADEASTASPAASSG